MFDINKPHQRRDGGEFEIVAIKSGYAFGFLTEAPATWIVKGNTLRLNSDKTSNLDIVPMEEPTELVVFTNVYPDDFGSGRKSPDDCTRVATSAKERVGMIKTTAKIIDGKLVSVKSEIVE